MIPRRKMIRELEYGMVILTIMILISVIVCDTMLNNRKPDITALMHAEGWFIEYLEHEDYNIYITEACSRFINGTEVLEDCIELYNEKYGKETCLKEAWIR